MECACQKLLKSSKVFDRQAAAVAALINLNIDYRNSPKLTFNAKRYNRLSCSTSTFGQVCVCVCDLYDLFLFIFGFVPAVTGFEFVHLLLFISFYLL